MHYDNDDDDNNDGLNFSFPFPFSFPFGLNYARLGIHHAFIGGVV